MFVLEAILLFTVLNTIGGLTVIGLLWSTRTKVHHTMTTLTELAARVDAQDNEIDKAIAYMQGEPARLVAAVAAAQAGDQATVDAITAAVDSHTEALTEALSGVSPTGGEIVEPETPVVADTPEGSSDTGADQSGDGATAVE